MRWLKADMKLLSEHRNSIRFSSPSSSSMAVRTTSPWSSAMVAPWLSKRNWKHVLPETGGGSVVLRHVARRYKHTHTRTLKSSKRKKSWLLGQARRTEEGSDSCLVDVPSFSRKPSWIRSGPPARSADPICSTCYCRKLSGWFYCDVSASHWPSAQSIGNLVRRQDGSKNGRTEAAGGRDFLNSQALDREIWRSRAPHPNRALRWPLDRISVH